MPYDVEAAVIHLTANAAAKPTGKCAKFVREALDAGGLVTDGRPMSAKNYGPFLTKKGFRSVLLKAYTAKKGDIVVIQSYTGGSVHGHIAMYDGQQWVSDFKQRDIWSGPGYREKKPAYEIFRR